MFGAASLLSSLTKRLTRLSTYELKVFTNARMIHYNTTFYVRFKESVPATVTSDKVAGSHDILFQNMRSAKTSSEVLNNINRHHSIMNSKHAVQALRSLFILQKGVSSVMSNGEVVNSKDFRKLCEVLKSQIRHLELNDLIDVLKCFGYLGVPSNSKIMSIVLGLISKQVNDLSLQQITFLDFVMKDMKITPLVSALKIALPIVFEANLQRKCDFEDVPLMSDLLCFVSKRRMADSSDVLVKALIDKREGLSVKDAQNIVFSMCETRVFSENYKLLLYHALDIITDSLNKMDFYEMDSILGRLCTKYLETGGDDSYYHEEFCNNCARLAVERNYSFEQTVWILKKLIKFNHVHLGLLTHVAAKMEREPWSLEQTGAQGLITVLTGLSNADFKPPNWDRIKSLVLKACQNLQDRPELPWLRLVLHLCILDCWSEEYFKKVFDQTFLSSFLARDYKLDQIQLMLLDQVSATLAPWDTKPRAPRDIVAPIVQLNRANYTTFPLQSSLEHGLGGQEYVLTGLFTSLGHFLDHVVVMRKGGYPVAINLANPETKERLTVDDIQVPSDSKMIAVLFVPPSMCAANNERVRGLFRIHINSVEAMGIAVAPVLHPVWNTLPDFERIPFLMRAIREKLPDSEITGVVTPV